MDGAGPSARPVPSSTGQRSSLRRSASHGVRSSIDLLFQHAIREGVRHTIADEANRPRTYVAGSIPGDRVTNLLVGDRLDDHPYSKIYREQRRDNDV